MADVNTLEQLALASIMGTKIPLPNLRQNFYSAILAGTVSVGGVAASRIMLSTTVGLFLGNGSPEGVVTASPSSLYFRADGSNGSLLYIKSSGAGNVGWGAVA